MRQYEMFELCLAGPVPKNSCVHVDLCAVFEKDGVSKTVKGFYAGDGIYVIRFLPQEAGVYHYKVSGIAFSEGDIFVEEAGSENHGIVKAKDTHFCFEDGTWFYPFGTTVYALSHQEDTTVEKTFDTLSKAPFNKIRLCVFPKHYDYNNNEPPKTSVRGMESAAIRAAAAGIVPAEQEERASDFAFEKDENGNWDVNHPVYGFWDKLEADICRLQELGLQADLILFHPYDNWGFAHLSKEDSLTYLAYLTRRLSAFPNVWWSLANEYDLMDYSAEDWNDFAQYIHDSDPYGHLLSNHMMIFPWDFSNPNATHICLQTGDVQQVTMQIQKYQKPLMIDETGYEGNIPMGWGSLSAFEEVNRFWTICAQGGYCTHGETYYNEEEILWWSKGGKLIGKSPDRIAFLRSIIESLPGPLTPAAHAVTKEEFEMMKEHLPAEQLAIPFVRLLVSCDWQQAQRILLDQHEPEGRCGDEAVLKYFGRKCFNKGKLDLPKEGSYDIWVIDVWEMTKTRVLTGVSGSVEVQMPGKEGIALLALKK